MFSEKENTYVRVCMLGEVPGRIMKHPPQLGRIMEMGVPQQKWLWNGWRGEWVEHGSGDVARRSRCGEAQAPFIKIFP